MVGRASCQLNRGPTTRAPHDQRPRLSDLRESGSIEQDANVVVLVYRHHLVDPQAPEDEAELIVAKNRNGAAPVTAYVDWEGRFTRFRDSKRTRPSEGGAADFGAAPRPGMRQPAAPAWGGVNGFGF
ncbi:DnaB-like helicase C-terminal domain-containing protein [Aeromicrobium fastidiosum]|nr:DnaB-like helicase C-terminal domain-containing protein [Aeromicrobium fastidiosum]